MFKLYVKLFSYLVNNALSKECFLLKFFLDFTSLMLITGGSDCGLTCFDFMGGSIGISCVADTTSSSTPISSSSISAMLVLDDIIAVIVSGSTSNDSSDVSTNPESPSFISPAPSCFLLTFSSLPYKSDLDADGFFLYAG